MVDEDDIIRDLARVPVAAESSLVISARRPDTMPTPAPAAVAVESDLIMPKSDRPFIYDLNSFSPRISDIPNYKLQDLLAACPDSDIETLVHLNKIQCEFTKNYVPMNSIHSKQSILFYENVLNANSLTLDTLKHGYRPGLHKYFLSL